MKLLSKNELQRVCPVKWHSDIPKDGISLGVADIDFKGPEGLENFICNHLTTDYSFYQAQEGLPIGIKAAVNYLKSKNIPTSTKNIQIIPGTMLGIYTAMEIISKRNGYIVSLGPIYEPIHRHATNEGNLIKWVDITSNGINEDQMIQKVTNETKMIAICNPTNPIGYNYKKSDLKLIRDLVIDYDLYCFSDELYAPLVFDKDHVSLGSIQEISHRSILLYGFSKAYGLAGYRSGFMYLGDDLAEEGRIIASQQLVSPSPITSLVCKFALEDRNVSQWVEHFRQLMQKTTKFAYKKFSDAGYDCIQPEGCFFVFPNLRTDDMELSELLLKQKGVQVVAGSKFGPQGKNHVRINCATSISRLDDAIDRILSFLKA